MQVSQLLKDTEFDHSRKVSQISGLMAQKAGYSQDESRIIAECALFHDVGKCAVPAQILSKPATLTPDEYEIVKTHAAIGYKRLCEAAQILGLAAKVAIDHHEHVDGCGYPHGITSNEMHKYAKIVACADVMDALYSRRAYKEPWNIPQIRDYFTARAGKQFDPAMVKILFCIMDDVLKLYETK